ncbi:hypothetical protein HGRIS_012654 [Hohenbuehelia grisea]|uniref:Peroxidase n=1 Tax=Hohenbuehelia grisea TaxID=104357 RepID=A0ABR3ISZ0_9AGAR
MADSGNGADGSIIKFASVETAYPANDGTDEIAALLKPFADKWHVSYGDIIQFSAAVAVSNCPGSAPIGFKAGRPAATQVPPDGLVPEPADSVTKILARFADAGFSAKEVVALLASHTIAAQDKVDPTVAGTPFDTTPERFDTQFFLETLLKGTVWPGQPNVVGSSKSPLSTEFRLLSDFAFARDSRTACEWQSFILDQAGMALKFKVAMEKLAVLGQNVGSLTDCSEVIPIPSISLTLPKLPPGKTLADLELSCPGAPTLIL